MLRHESARFLFHRGARSADLGVLDPTLTTEFHLADILDSDEAIAEYLSQIFADGDSDELLRAIGYIAKAQGMAKIPHDAGLSRESLYKSFSVGAKHCAQGHSGAEYRAESTH